MDIKWGALASFCGGGTQAELAHAASALRARLISTVSRLSGEDTTSIPVIDRRAFIGRWADRGRELGDPFDAFFALWIALVIRARPELRPEDHALDDTDRRAVLRLSESYRDEIFREVDSRRDDLAWLARRRGTRRGDPIVDVHDYCRNGDHLRDRFRRLADHYAGTQAAKPGLIVEAVIELLNHVRNNLFHGIKDPEDVDDRDLVTHLVPVLQAVLRGGGQP